MPGEPAPDDAAGLRAANARLREVIAARDAEIAVLRMAQEASAEVIRRLELRLAEVERRLAMDSSNSGTPTSREGIAAGEQRKARQRSERERSKDRERGGQPGRRGKGLSRDPDPDDREAAGPPAECRSCHASLAGAAPAGPGRAQVIDIGILRKVTGVLLPGLACGGCGKVTHAAPPPGFRPGSVAYGPVLNAAAVLPSCHGNVPAERAAQLIGMLAAEDVLAADETPVNVLDKTPLPAPAAGDAGGADPEEKDGKKAAAGSPHVLVVTTPDARLRLLLALASRRKAAVGAGIPAGFTGHLMTDGYAGYQHLLDRIAGIQQCCQHVIRRWPGAGQHSVLGGGPHRHPREGAPRRGGRPRPRRHRPRPKDPR